MPAGDTALDPQKHSMTCANATTGPSRFGNIHNRLRDWDTGNHPGYALACWLRDYKEQVFLFTREFAVSWTNNVSERGAKAAKRHQAVSGYWHSLATLARWCSLRSYLDSAAAHGITALDAITQRHRGKAMATATPRNRLKPTHGTPSPQNLRRALLVFPKRDRVHFAPNLPAAFDGIGVASAQRRLRRSNWKRGGQQKRVYSGVLRRPYLRESSYRQIAQVEVESNLLHTLSAGGSQKIRHPEIVAVGGKPSAIAKLGVAVNVRADHPCVDGSPGPPRKKNAAFQRHREQRKGNRVLFDRLGGLRALRVPGSVAREYLRVRYLANPEVQKCPTASAVKFELVTEKEGENALESRFRG